MEQIGLKVERQKEISVTFDGKEIGRHRLDLLVNDTIILELKAMRYIEDVHFAVVRSYLRAFGLQHGLLMNFSKIVLDVKRVICK